MKKVIMGIGVPGAGKTTVLKGFAEKNGYAYVCPDDIRLKLCKNAQDQTKNREVWQKAYDDTANFLADGKTVIFDATFANQSDRIKFIDFAREHGAEKIQGVFMDVPLEVAKERNAGRERVVPEFVLERMDDSLKKSPPDFVDGFDSIFTLNELQELVEVEKINEQNEVFHKEFKI